MLDLSCPPLQRCRVPRAPPPNLASSPTKLKPVTATYTSGRYIVTFTDEPAASYAGTVKGYPATRHPRGQKLTKTALGSRRGPVG